MSVYQQKPPSASEQVVSIPPILRLMNQYKRPICTVAENTPYPMVNAYL